MCNIDNILLNKLLMSYKIKIIPYQVFRFQINLRKFITLFQPTISLDSLPFCSLLWSTLKIEKHVLQLWNFIKLLLLNIKFQLMSRWAMSITSLEKLDKKLSLFCCKIYVLPIKMKTMTNKTKLSCLQVSVYKAFLTGIRNSMKSWYSILLKIP